MFIGLDSRFPDLCDKNSFAFQLRIFDLRKLETMGDTLKNSRDFVIQLWGYKGLFVIYPCHTHVSVFRFTVFQ